MAEQLPLMLLKHTSYYWFGEEKVRFMAEVKQVGTSRTPLARFEKAAGDWHVTFGPWPYKERFPDGPADFEIVYKQGAWYAGLREAAIK
ncbi:hypothetical protein Ac42p135 [Acinetobacter phage Ac42]|uniref:hypothetical protein n=1 Tax=Acinetobacter phage Ac42 TaxID=762660 RepID=UPI0001EBCD5E|nr:hypothetical protein Ac42p135 [Acinetobacter phage Ac42]ADI96373.1 hypothetical protein Ac42p135 [Acinetobacter phage Ac42]